MYMKLIINYHQLGLILCHPNTIHNPVNISNNSNNIITKEREPALNSQMLYRSSPVPNSSFLSRNCKVGNNERLNWAAMRNGLACY